MTPLQGTWPVRLTLIAVLAGGPYAAYRIFVWPRIHAEEIFAGRLKEWNAVDYTYSSDSVREEEIPYRTGRVFILRMGRGNRVTNSKFLTLDPFIDPVWHQLSDEVRARKPEETRTLILIGPSTLPHDRKTITNGGDQAIIEIERVTQVMPLRVYDLHREFLIGAYDLALTDGAGYEEPLKRFIETMPVR